MKHFFGNPLWPPVLMISVKVAPSVKRSDYEASTYQSTSMNQEDLRTDKFRERWVLSRNDKVNDSFSPFVFAMSDPLFSLLFCLSC